MYIKCCPRQQCEARVRDSGRRVLVADRLGRERTVALPLDVGVERRRVGGDHRRGRRAGCRTGLRRAARRARGRAAAAAAAAAARRRRARRRRAGRRRRRSTRRREVRARERVDDRERGVVAARRQRRAGAHDGVDAPGAGLLGEPAEAQDRPRQREPRQSPLGVLLGGEELAHAAVAPLGRSAPITLAAGSA